MCPLVVAHTVVDAPNSKAMQPAQDEAQMESKSHWKEESCRKIAAEDITKKRPWKSLEASSDSCREFAIKASARSCKSFNCLLQ